MEVGLENECVKQEQVVLKNDNVIELNEYMYIQFLKKHHPSGMVCIDEKNQVYQKLKQFKDLNDEERDVFNWFSKTANEFFNAKTEIM